MSDLSLRYEIRPMIYTLSSVYPVSLSLPSPTPVIVCNEEGSARFAARVPDVYTCVCACVRSPDRKRGRRITHQGCGTVIIPPRTRPLRRRRVVSIIPWRRCSSLRSCRHVSVNNVRCGGWARKERRKKGRVEKANKGCVRHGEALRAGYSPECRSYSLRKVRLSLSPLMHIRGGFFATIFFDKYAE